MAQSGERSGRRGAPGDARPPHAPAFPRAIALVAPAERVARAALGGISLAAVAGVTAALVAASGRGVAPLNVFLVLVGGVSAACTYLVWWRRALPLAHKLGWTLVLLIPASGHLYFLAVDRMRRGRVGSGRRAVPRGGVEPPTP